MLEAIVFTLILSTTIFTIFQYFILVLDIFQDNVTKKEVKIRSIPIIGIIILAYIKYKDLDD